MTRNAPHAALIVPGARLGSGQLEPEPELEPSQSGISIGSARPSLAWLMKVLGSARQADRSANTGSATASSGSGSCRNTSGAGLWYSGCHGLLIFQYPSSSLLFQAITPLGLVPNCHPSLLVRIYQLLFINLTCLVMFGETSTLWTKYPFECPPPFVAEK